MSGALFQGSHSLGAAGVARKTGLAVGRVPQGVRCDTIVAFSRSTHQQAKDHWIRYGINEGRRSSANFSPASYLHRYIDLVAACGATGYDRAIVHYLFWGKSEGRSGAP